MNKVAEVLTSRRTLLAGAAAAAAAGVFAPPACAAVHSTPGVGSLFEAIAPTTHTRRARFGRSPRLGEPRQSRLTPDEVRTQFTPWTIARLPLILGTNLTKLDDFTRSLITNKGVIAVNQEPWECHQCA